jgi:hypothetical protein
MVLEKRTDASTVANLDTGKLIYMTYSRNTLICFYSLDLLLKYDKADAP